MYADFEFDQYDSNSLNGRGRETDYAPALDDYGNYIYDNDGNMVYDSQELRFAWYIDPKTGDISIKYDNSGYLFTTECAPRWQSLTLNLAPTAPLQAQARPLAHDRPA